MLAGRLRIARVATLALAICMVASCDDDQASIEAVSRGVSVWVTNRSPVPKYLTVVVVKGDGSGLPEFNFARYLAPPGTVLVGAPVPSLPGGNPLSVGISVANSSCANEATWDFEGPGNYHLTIQADESADLERFQAGNEPIGNRTLAESNVCDS